MKKKSDFYLIIDEEKKYNKLLKVIYIWYRKLYKISTILRMTVLSNYYESDNIWHFKYFMNKYTIRD